MRLLKGKHGPGKVPSALDTLSQALLSSSLNKSGDEGSERLDGMPEVPQPKGYSHTRTRVSYHMNA